MLVILVLLVSLISCCDEAKEYSDFSQCYKITVDYSQSIAQMIGAGGYDCVDPDITAEHFPIQGDSIKSVEVFLFHFNYSIFSEDAIVEMDKDGYRPVNAAELFGLGAQHPQLQLEFPIVCLGTIWQCLNGLNQCPVLGTSDGFERRLTHYYFGRSWYAGYRFAVASK